MSFPQIIELPSADDGPAPAPAQPLTSGQQPTKKAKKTNEQIAAGQLRTAAMWQDIRKLREVYRVSIMELADKHGR